MEFGIIEEAINSANRLAACSPWLKFLSNCSSLPGFFKFLTVSDNHPFLTALDLTLSMVRFELAFLLLNYLSESNEENKLYNFLILLNGIFHYSRIWNYTRSLQGG